MRLRSSVLLLSTVLLAYSVTSQNGRRERRMASGTDVEVSEVPYQVSVRLIETDRHLGSGAILNVRFVVTQASFLYKLLRQYQDQELRTLARIRLGQLELHSHGSDQFRPIQSCTFHPEFDFELALNDVALLKTSTSIEFNRLVRPISLRRGPIPENSIVQYTDWGAGKSTATQEDFYEKLQKLNAQAMSNERCRQLLSGWDLQDFVYDSRVCIYTNGVGSVCTGNVGGPLVMIENGTPQLVGVMTYVYRACNASAPSGFERLWNHYGWISRSSTINYKFADFGETCRTVRNVASQLLRNKKNAVLLRKAARGLN